VNTAEGTKLLPHYTFATAPSVDILVIPSGRGSWHSYLTAWYSGAWSSGNIVGSTLTGQPVMYYGNSSATIDWVNTTAASAKIVTSHCWGAFTLAQAGVLDGKNVTTFPGYTDDLKAAYPAIANVVADQRFVIDGKVMTSNGGLAAFEAALYIVRHIYGETKATAVGPTGLVYSSDNIGHSKLEFYRTSPATGTAPTASFEPVVVGILLLDGMFITEPVGPFDIFVHGNPNMTVFFVSPDMNPKVTWEGATMYPDKVFADALTIDVLVVPSGIGSHWSFLNEWYDGMTASDGTIQGKTMNNVSVTYYGNMTNVINYIKTVAAQATYVTSHCWGAFTLAEAGLLDGLEVTTFPSYGTTLKQYYPKIKQVHDTTRRIVKDGNVITSNGGVAAYEAANYVLKLLYGEYQAKTVAMALVFAADNYAISNQVLEVNSAPDSDVKAESAGASPRLLAIFNLALALVFVMW